MSEISNIGRIIKEKMIEMFKFEISPEDIDDEMMIINGGLFLDSIAAITLLVELEREFGITIDNGNLNFSNINSIISLSNYIYDKLTMDNLK